METIDDDSIVGSMTRILTDYKSGGGYLDGDSKEIWQQLQTSINNFGNNIHTPTPPDEYPNVLTNEHRIWLLDHLTRLEEEQTSDSMSIAHDVIRRGRYSDWEQNELNEMRKIMIEINRR